MKASFITPAITAFQADGSLDLHAQGRLYDHLIEGGVNGILILGSIGEFFAMDEASRRRLVQFTIEHVAGRVELLIGTGGMDAKATVSLSNDALKAGADGVVVISPYYFALANADIEAYYDTVASRVDGSVFLYNFPDRTGYDISPAVTANLLSRHQNIAGYKDSLAGSDHTRALIQAVKPSYPHFRIYCGYDENFARTVLSGGDGCIGGLSNPFPSLFARWVSAFERDDMAAVAALQQTVDELMAIYGVGTPFVPFIKEAVRLAGVDISSRATFPLPSPTPEQTEALRAIIAHALPDGAAR